METRAFVNRMRTLFDINGDLLPELSPRHQAAFLRDPVSFFLHASEAHANAIMREVEKRQPLEARSTASALQEFAAAIPQASADAVRKPRRRRAHTSDGQRELLMPIPGGIESHF